MNKILDLIFEDVKNENETKKTAVTLRISALIFIGYFLCLMAVFCSMGDWMNVGGCLVCGVCYVLSFYTTYLDHTRESAWISQILMIVWIILFIVMFGWDCGVQHYLFAFLALNFTVSTAGERRKVLTAVGACALRLALYAYARNFKPYSPLDPGISVLIQILNTIFIFAQITAVMIIFTKDAQKMEQKLVRYNTKLQKLASVDALTGLWNRRSMWEYIRAVEYDYEVGNGRSVLLRCRQHQIVFWMSARSRSTKAPRVPTTPATLASTSILPYFFITVSTTLRQSSAEETSAFRKVTSPSFSFLMLFFRFFLAF